MTLTAHPSAVDVEVDDAQPLRPVAGYADVISAQLTQARSELADLFLVSAYEHTDMPGVVKGDFLRGSKDARPANLYDAVFSNVEGSKRPPRGDKLAVAIAAGEYRIEKLESELAEQTDLARLYAAWAAVNGAEAIETVTDPKTLQMLVGLLDGQVKDLEARVEALESAEADVEAALTEPDAA